MKINRVRLQTGNAQTILSLPIVGAQPSDPYLLKDAQGLGPPDIDIYMDNTPALGGYYQGRRPQLRQPILSVGLNPDYGSNMTAADLRSALYAALSPSNDNPALTLQLMLDNTVIAQCTVYVKSMPINLFSKDPQVDMTFESSDRYFKAPALLTDLPANVGGNYPYQINNPGSVNCGFHLKFTTASIASGASIGGVSILNQQSGKVMNIIFGFGVGWFVELSTVPGNRFANTSHYNPAPQPMTFLNILDWVDPDNSWLSLVPGVNNLDIRMMEFIGGFGARWVSVPPTTFEFTPQFWGV